VLAVKAYARTDWCALASAPCAALTACAAALPRAGLGKPPRPPKDFIVNRTSPSNRYSPAAPSQGCVKVAHECTESLRYSLNHYPHNGRYVFTATLKVSDGIRHYVALSKQRPSHSDMATQCQEYGIFSARPYRLGQAHDDSISICVYALYQQYCLTTRLDPNSLLARAYPGWERPQDWTDERWADIRQGAEWEGTMFPDAWSVDEALLLLQALRAINRHFLADVLEERILSGARSKPVRERDYGGTFDGFRVSSDADPGL